MAALIAGRQVGIVEGMIFANEGTFALSVRADFRDGLRRCATDQDRIAYCREWLTMYHLPKLRRMPKKEVQP